MREQGARGNKKYGRGKEVAFHSLNRLNFFLFGVHILLFLFFTVCHITLMSVFNVCSVLFYVSGFFAVKKERNSGYIIATFIEIMLHMFLAVICLGWDYGFQLYFIGCIAVVFYADYFSARLGKRRLKGTLFNVISSVLYFVTFFLMRRNSALYEINDNMALVVFVGNSLVVFVFVSVFFRMLTNMAIFYERELTEQASHDMLTGLVNRYFLIEQLQEIYNSGNMSDYWLAILDVDDFKRINDAYGHNFGDYVLKTVAELIQKNCGGLTACRWGGEEFILVGHAGECGAQPEQPGVHILEQIRRCVEQEKFEYGDKSICVTVTIGVAEHIENQTIDELINIADSKLYQGKKNGKNQVVM